jgi:hypothetical protein
LVESERSKSVKYRIPIYGLADRVSEAALAVLTILKVVSGARAVYSHGWFRQN